MEVLKIVLKTGDTLEERTTLSPDEIMKFV